MCHNIQPSISHLCIIQVSQVCVVLFCMLESYDKQTLWPLCISPQKKKKRLKLHFNILFDHFTLYNMYTIFLSTIIYNFKLVRMYFKVKQVNIDI